MFKNVVANLLAAFARAILRKYHPTVVMVTGSVGKTSTKDAVAVVLSRSRLIRASVKSYNSEFGVPLTIIGAKNPWENPFAWVRVFGEALALLVLPNLYPKLLVLEVGADRPGDLARILKIATPDVVVLTQLPDVPVHVETFAAPEQVREEEFAPAYALASGAPLVLSADDQHARALAMPLSVQVISFGNAHTADVRIGELTVLVEEGQPTGMETTISIAGTTHPMVVRGALGAPQLLAPAAALATALALGDDLAEAFKGLESYVPPPGRGRLLAGKEGALLIDDSYNASPAAVEEGLKTLALAARALPRARRVAILGDMLELGRFSNEEHAKIGGLVPASSDVLVTVGPRAKVIAQTALAAGMHEDNILSFETAHEAVTRIENIIRPQDIILIKGSQSVRTERITERLLQNPADRALLVRQEEEWRRR